jgi:putative transposase
MNRAYKVEINPNNRQRTLLAQSAGCARFAYNWGLNQRIKLYQESKESMDAVRQHKELCKIKKTEFPWMYNVTKCAPQEALRNLDEAFVKFFKGLKNGQKVGFPKFKKKHGSKCSFKVTTGSFYVTKKSIKIPKIPGEIRIKNRQTGINKPEDYIPTKGIKILSFTISKEAGKWFCSVSCEVPDISHEESPLETLGLDVGIKELGTVSDGRVYHNPKALNKLERTLNRKQRERCRRKKGSNNRLRTIKRLQRIHYRISCVRKDAIHKMTSDLVKTKPVRLVIEDLSVKNMLKNHRLSKALADASFGEIRRQLEYKAKWYGSEIVIADKFYPSSKTCSGCGLIKDDLKLSDRTYLCECGLELDRDLNAAINLQRYGEFPRSLLKQKARGKESLQTMPDGMVGAPLRSEKETSDLSLGGRFV